MSTLTFRQLNHGWNAEPNAPSEHVRAMGSDVQLTFYLNPWQHKAQYHEVGYLTFRDCRAWRLGIVNDHAWFQGDCRYSKAAPAWGEFYELVGENSVRDQPTDWRSPPVTGSGDRHFLFYLRDNEFECFAADWSFERRLPRSRDGSPARGGGRRAGGTVSS